MTFAHALRAACPRLILAALAGTALTAQAPAVLTGMVSDGTGRPEPGALVELTGAGLKAPWRATTDARGAFTMAGLPAGAFLVSVRQPGSFAFQRHLTLPAGRTRVLQIKLHPYAATVAVTDRAHLTELAELDAPVNHLLGIADTASEGIVTPGKLDERAYLRVGEVLETVPGLLISQHSGEGKANQYYLRGFDLDHGTDLSTTVAGLPVNLPTHAHGQGYSDLNFMIPELVSRLQYQKGPFFAQEGDFSAAGSVQIEYVHALNETLASVDLGQEGYRRTLAAGSLKVGGGDLLGAVEALHNDGPWVHPDEYRKVNAVVRYSWAGPADVLELTGMTYSGRWHSTDQVPERALASGALSRWGAVDPTDGGTSRRDSAIASWTHRGPDAQTQVTGYASSYALDLFSNFTFFLADPLRGDQVEQMDRRVTTGLKATTRWSGVLFDRPSDTQAGFEVRHDNIPGLGLYHTQAQQRLSVTAQDAVTESSEAFHVQNKLQWTPVLRSMVGLREDLFQVSVRTEPSVNGGRTRAALASPKASLTLGPWLDTEGYLSFGQGFHSNDARGTTLTPVPGGLDPMVRAPLLVRATGFEAGVRTAILPAWQSTLALFRLDLASELVFDADDGTTQPGGPTRRTGVEWNNEIHATPRLTLTADLAYTRARFTDAEPAGNDLPEAIKGMGILGVHWQASNSLDLSVLHRYFGPRALTQDDRVHSQASDLTQGQARWRPSKRLTCSAEVFNLFNRKAADIDYYYVSRLQGEPAPGVAGIVTHPVEPRQLRVSLQYRF